MFKLSGIVFALYTVFPADCCRLPEEPVLAFDTFFSWWKFGSKHTWCATTSLIELENL